MNWIDYKDLPTDGSAFSSLFIDYITDYDKVRKFYPGNFRDESDWKRILADAAHRSRSPG